MKRQMTKACSRAACATMILLAGLVQITHRAVAQAPEFVNFETPQVHPIALSPSGQVLVAVNTADNHLEVFDIKGGLPVRRGSVFTGLEPISVRMRGDLVVELPAKPVDPACSVVRLDLDGDVLPMSFLVFPDASGALSLTPHDATLDGPSIRVERVGVIGDVTHNIGYWLDPVATAAWPIGIGASQSGTYRVEVDLACTDAAAGSRMRLEIEGGAGAPEFTVPATGGWQSYRTIDVGRVELPMGSHRAILRALSKPGEAVANIRSIRLIRETKP